MILDGKQLSQELKDEMRQEVDALAQKYGRRPCLMVVIVGNNPASQSYVRGKIKATEYVGFEGSLVSLPEDVTEDALIAEIERLNQNELVDGILVQLPLPKHISEDRVIASISPEKDVDGFHATNVARLWLNQPCIVPCTPKGVIVMLDRAGIEITGKNAVVVGRSNIVGKPVAKLLLDRNATVTIAHSRTKNLKEVCRQADILVAAVGRPQMLTADYIKPGAAVIDVGINRLEDGRLVGDVDFEGAKAIAGAITPVPGGVGPMTITMLMRNTIECFLRRMNNN
ncbi:MAG: bifunctional methylenetetrahydrofolate dehydrogenase/methenyltetrahydrofolate cyclohydrolase FolD [Bacteroidales bacterium]|nr:bifunctional methylenetetrahydrofolate dehydrogenase/methenyltetrahydrofolate cyclohydrolase FolD [Bacteroidales bacterium]